MVTDTGMSGYIAQWFENTLFRSSAIWSETGLDVRVPWSESQRKRSRRGVLRDVVLLEKASRFSVLPTGFGSTQGTSGGRSA